jgi:hypothetical protein
MGFEVFREADGDYLVSVLRDNPHCVNYTRDVTQNRQKDINPEVLTNPYLQEYPQGRQEDRGYDA